MRVAIVGAGISGLLCAQRISELVPGVAISVFEWGRGPGGRTARRRVTLDDGREISFDHASPYISATTDSFHELLGRWQAVGVAAQWSDDFWVGTPSNNAIAKHIVANLEASGASMFFGHHVLAAEYTTDLLWQVDVKGRQTGETVKLEFDALVLSDKLLVLPNMYSVLADAQAGVLALPNTLTSTGAVVMLVALERTAACGALFPGAAESGVLSSSDYPQLDSRVIEKVVHDSAKPGRQAEGLDLWVVHSTAEYAAVHLRGEALDDEAAVLAEMRQAFLGSKGGDLDLAVAYASVMAWDHAQPSPATRLVDEPCRLDATRRAGVCGDFFGPHTGVEAAALSGIALAKAMVPLLLRQGKEQSEL